MRQSSWDEILEILTDPVDGSPLSAEGGVLVGGSGRTYQISSGQPILLSAMSLTTGGWRFATVVAGQQSEVRSTSATSGKARRLLKRMVDADRSARVAVDRLRADLDRRGVDRPRILVVGGGTVGLGSAGLFDIPGAEVISLDVYPSDATTFVADAHRIPLADQSVDVVWVQAVLEHVVDPRSVVDQVARVLVPSGLIYAETPFLQPVHEGPYDFCRFSHSGHRLLFADFEEISSGATGGPGAMASLATRGLVGGLTRSRLVGRIAGVATMWFALLDRFVEERWKVDFATGSYFYGLRRDECPRDFDAPTYYRGAQ